MIRKIAFLFIVLFILAWIIMAHVAKSKIIALIKHSETDNIKISYNDSGITGFPFSFTVRFSNPKITITNQVASREISADYLNCELGYSLTGGKFEFSNNIHYSTFDETSVEYYFQSEDQLLIKADFSKSLYKSDKSISLTSLLKNIYFNAPVLTAFNNKKEELFELADLEFKIESSPINGSESFKLKMMGGYNSSLPNRKINNAKLFAEAGYTISEKNSKDGKTPDFDRHIALNKAEITLGNTSCDIDGEVSLSRSRLPHGKLSVHLVRYDDFVDLILPDNFIFSKPYVKKMIAKAAAIEFSNEISNEVRFDISLTENGISFGRVNLLDLKGE